MKKMHFVFMLNILITSLLVSCSSPVDIEQKEGSGTFSASKETADTFNKKNGNEVQNSYSPDISFINKNTKYFQLANIPYIGSDNNTKQNKLYVHSNINLENSGEKHAPNAFAIYKDFIFILDTLGCRILQIKNNILINEISFTDYPFTDLLDFWVVNEDNCYIINEPISRGIFQYSKSNIEKMESISQDILSYEFPSIMFRDAKLLLGPGEGYYEISDGFSQKKDFPWGLKVKGEYIEDINLNKRYKVLTPKHSNYSLLGKDCKGNIYMECYKNILSVDSCVRYLLRLDINTNEVYISEIRRNAIIHRDLFVDVEGNIYQMNLGKSSLTIDKIIQE